MQKNKKMLLFSYIGCLICLIIILFSADRPITQIVAGVNILLQVFGIISCFRE